MSANNYTKTLVIGLDGATFDVIDPLIEMGKLPNIEKLKQGGAFSKLQSTFPPITGPAWLAVATGKSPNKTGIYDFTILREETTDFSRKPIGSKNFNQNGAFWDYLSKAGRNIIIYNYPMLFPPYKIKGYMISGLGSSPQDKITYPEDLKNEIDNLIPEYKINIPWTSPQYKDNVDLFLTHATELLEINWTVTKYLLRNKKWDLFIAIFSVTDFIQHFMWKYWNNTNLKYESKNYELYRNEFIKFWEKIDEIIGELHYLTISGTNLFVISDHGFGPHDQTFYLNSWLEKEGYLVRKNMKKMTAGTIILMKKALKTIAPGIHEILSRRGALVKQASRVQTINTIDFYKSKAFSLGTSGLIYLNTFKKDDRQRDKIKNELTQRLQALSLEFDQISEVEIHDLRPSSENSNETLEPDLYLAINNFRCGIMNEFSRKIFQSKPLFMNQTGYHTMDGIFIAYGSIIKPIKMDKAHLIDIAPTILHIFHHSIPSDMDGNVLTDIFHSDYLERHGIQKVKHYQPDDENIVLPRDDEEEVQARLKSLGYL